MPHSAFPVSGIIRHKVELKEIYATTIIRGFSLSLVSVFIPLFMIDMGYSLNQALFFLAVYYLALSVFGPLAVIVSSKFGMKHTMLVGPFFTVAYLLLLQSVTTVNSYIYIISAIGAVGAVMYWIPLNSHFSKSSDNKKRGVQTGLYEAFPNIAAVAAPVAGGLIISSLGFNILFWLAAILLLFSVAPLFMSYEYKCHMKYKWSKIFSKENLHWFNDFFIQGFLLVAVAIIFPIYIYYVSHEFLITGAVVSLMGLGIAICSIAVGTLSDRFGKNAVIKSGGILLAAIFIALVLVKAPLFIYTLSFFSGIGWSAIMIPLFAVFCDNLKPGTRTEFMGFRDVAYGIGRGAALLLIIAIPAFFQFQAAFLVAALAAIYFTAINV